MHDSFDPSAPSLWEHIFGGKVSAECSAMSGNALCFKDSGSRFAATAPLNTIAGGTVRFSLNMLANDTMPVRTRAHGGRRSGRCNVRCEGLGGRVRPPRAHGARRSALRSGFKGRRL